MSESHVPGELIPPEERALLLSQRDDLEERLRVRRRAARRHTLWAVLGVSPATLIPLLAAVHDFGPEIAGFAAVLVLGVEGWRAVQARADVREIEAALEEVDAALEGQAPSADRAGPSRVADA